MTKDEKKLLRRERREANQQNRQERAEEIRKRMTAVAIREPEIIEVHPIMPPAPAPGMLNLMRVLMALARWR